MKNYNVVKSLKINVKIYALLYFIIKYNITKALLKLLNVLKGVGFSCNKFNSN